MYKKSIDPLVEGMSDKRLMMKQFGVVMIFF